MIIRSNNTTFERRRRSWLQVLNITSFPRANSSSCTKCNHQFQTKIKFGEVNKCRQSSSHKRMKNTRNNKITHTFPKMSCLLSIYPKISLQFFIVDISVKSSRSWNIIPPSTCSFSQRYSTMSKNKHPRKKKRVRERERP